MVVDRLGVKQFLVWSQRDLLGGCLAIGNRQQAVILVITSVLHESYFKNFTHP